MDCSRTTPAQVIRRWTNNNLTLHFIIEGGEGTLNSKFLLCNKLRNEDSICRAVLEAETAPIPNLLQNHLSTTPMYSVCDSHFLEQSPHYQFRICCRICWKNLLCHVLPNIVCRILFWQTHQSLSEACLVVQLKLDQLDIDVVDHRALLVSTHGKKCSYLFMTDVVVVVRHAQLRKPFYCHGHTDRRDIGVAARWITIQDRVQDPIYRSAFWVLGIIFV